MSAVNPAHRTEALATLASLFQHSNQTSIIHYSCESFYDRPQGRSPRITSIAVRRLDSGQTRSFSIHQMAERKGYDLGALVDRYDELEKLMLDEFFDFVREHREMKYIHWNMRDANYGFAAIEHRYRVLGGEPDIIPNHQKFDLSRLLVAMFGTGYIGHPRLEKLVEKNKISNIGGLSGREEAEAFDEGRYHELHQSTLRKVDIIANIAGRTNNRELKTNSSWWEVHGGGVKQATEWVVSHPFWAFLIGTLTVASVLIAALQWFG